jgi:hypothetical protein
MQCIRAGLEAHFDLRDPNRNVRAKADRGRIYAAAVLVCTGNAHLRRSVLPVTAVRALLEASLNSAHITLTSKPRAALVATCCTNWKIGCTVLQHRRKRRASRRAAAPSRVRRRGRAAGAQVQGAGPAEKSVLVERRQIELRAAQASGGTPQAPHHITA